MQKLKKLQETRRNLRKNKKGFTLVELLVVLAILAILIAVAVPTLTGVLNDAKDKTYLQEARAAYIAYLLKATDQTSPDKVSLADINAYTGETATAIQITIKTEGGEPTAVTHFKYQPDGLSGKYIDMPLGTGGNTKGSVVSGTIADGDNKTVFKLS